MHANTRTGYLGEGDKESWKQHDAVELMAAGSAGSSRQVPILIDTGSADNFLHQLRPDAFEAACKKAGYSALTCRMQDGYDHSYFFVSTFIDEHVAMHAAALHAAGGSGGK